LSRPASRPADTVALRPARVCLDDARPAYPPRSQRAAADILLQERHLQSSEAVLAAGGSIRAVRPADLRTRDMNDDERPSRQQRQVSGAVPVACDGVKTTPNVTRLVLDTAEAIPEATPMVNESRSLTPRTFEKESAVVDAHRKAHVAEATTN
jgi:hypothetical protein